MEYRNILCELLNCGYGDIEMLKDLQYDYDDIKEELNEMYCDKWEFNDILRGAIWVYKHNIQDVIDSRVKELNFEISSMESWYDDSSIDVQEEDKIKWDKLCEEKENLEQLDASEDIDYFVNYLDTHIYIRNDEIKAIYRKYLQDDIDVENDKIGFVSLDLGDDE